MVSHERSSSSFFLFLFSSPFHLLILSARFFSTTHYLPPRYSLSLSSLLSLYFPWLEHISSSFFKQFRWDTKRGRVPFSGISLDKHHGRCPVASLGHAAPGIRRRLASRRPFTSSPPLFWPVANLSLSLSLSLSLFLLANKWDKQIDNAPTTCIINSSAVYRFNIDASFLFQDMSN